MIFGIMYSVYNNLKKMKKIFSLIAVITGFIVFTAMQTENKPEFKFEKETHDFGKVPAGKPVSVDFIFTNTGDAPLIISNIESTCGCTVPKFTTKPVLKGEKGIITVTFNAAAVQAGFTKAVTIKSNARTPSKMLYIKGEVVPAGN
ncbi:Protein of unknown function [Daejeonella rubra]|uniref:DUF1573 domain-containing protein n=2 Tax=Daejeonella rubra TaxID=990371 RepID=A0A1G9UNE5_9SPHI|nr:Protein of unknown function [Daejeonella rubra]